MKYNIAVCGCGRYMEIDEKWCQDCHTFDCIEAEDTDIFLDSLDLESELEDVIYDMSYVSISRRD